MSNTFLGRIVDHCLMALDPLRDALTDANKFQALLLELGWRVGNLPVNEVQQIVDALDELFTAVENLPANPKEEDIIDIVLAIADVYQKIKNNVNAIGNALTSLGPLQTDFIAEFPWRLCELLIVKYLNRHEPKIYAVLELLSVIDQVYIPETAGRPGFYRTTLDLSVFADLIKNPTEVLKQMIGWNTIDFAFQKLARIFMNYLSTKKIPTSYYKPSYTDIQKFNDGFGFNNSSNGAIDIRVASIPVGNEYLPFGVKIIEYLGATYTDFGIILQLELPSGITLTQAITDDLSLSINLSTAIGESPAFLIAPSGLQFKFLNQPGTTFPPTGINIGLKYSPATPKILFGKPEGSRLQVKNGAISVGAKYDGALEIVAEADFSGLSFIIDAGDSDGFIKKVFGEGQKEITFPLIVHWSSVHGITFKGSGAFEVSFAANIQLGPILISNALLAIKAPQGQDAVKLEIGATVSGVLGPVSFIVENIGLALKLNTTEGNMGPFGIKPGFKPPKGIGLKIKASVVEGGGYIYLDPDKGRYYGALELKFTKFGLTAIGIITTKNPDGSSGFSMLLLINVTFSPSIPIGFGFSLSGVGGIAGVNRSMNPEPMRQGVKTGAINHILFPENVIDNIQTIITDLENIFPTQQKRYTFGLMFLLGWGTPTPLVRIKLGVIIEVPSPVKLAIIGVVSLILPSKEKPVLQLNVAFAGIIDFDKKYLTFDASIYDSKILTFSLFGDMAVRIFWGEHREMLMSVGGFHPAYSPPAYLLLPAKMDRITISIFNEENLRLQFATYFAITSNTFQFGARIDFYLKVWKLQVIGLFGFDVLFQFNPFKFQTGMYAMLAVMWGDRELLVISLDFFLEGPGPWHARGHAEFKVLGLKRKAEFDKTWGPQPSTTLPDVAVVPLIQADIEKTENWQATLPAQKQLLVQLQQLPSDVPVLDPLGTLSVTQKIAPLGIKLERFGTQKPLDGGIYDITGIRIGNLTYTGAALQPALENFAPAQFRSMNDDQKLKASSFEFLKSGVKVKATAALTADRFATKKTAYEVTIIDDVHTHQPQSLTLNRRLVNDFTKGGLVASNPVARKARAEVSTPAVRASLAQEQYRLVSKDSLTELSQVSGSGINNTLSGSMADALTLREKLVLQNPSLAGQIAVVPVY